MGEGRSAAGVGSARAGVTRLATATTRARWLTASPHPACRRRHGLASPRGHTPSPPGTARASVAVAGARTRACSAAAPCRHPPPRPPLRPEIRSRTQPAPDLAGSRRACAQSSAAPALGAPGQGWG
eukprot:scaffold35904_cov51-Phaeocystis_antarctica.AAC.2